jgi:obscurin-RhoGEF protein
MQDLVVEEGGSAELLCQYSRPVQATWKMDEREVCTDGHRVIIEQDWTVARLTFRPALPRDSGIYSCEAAGTRVVALLQVQGEATWQAAPGPAHLWCGFGYAISRMTGRQQPSL